MNFKKQKIIALSLCLAPINPLNALEHTCSAKIFLTAKEIQYNQDKKSFTAFGRIKLSYDKNELYADQLIYNKKTNKIIAQGNVRILSAQGSIATADKIDLTKDLGQGFLTNLKIETKDKVYFSADKAEQNRKNEKTIFYNASYTTCIPHEIATSNLDPWKIKAKKITWDKKSNMIKFESSRFDFFGLPVLWLPKFSIADGTIKRKSGFEAPQFKSNSTLGWGIKTSYYWSLTPSYDLTLSSTIFTKQLPLFESQWRQQLEHGAFDITVAGLYQKNKKAFSQNSTDYYQNLRFMVASKGYYNLSPSWQLGWDLFEQSDYNFAKTYDIKNYEQREKISKIFLRYLSNHSYFNLAGKHFHIQESLLDSNPLQISAKQPFTIPNLTYSIVKPNTFYGGQLEYNTDLALLYYPHGSLKNYKKNKSLDFYWRNNAYWDKRIILNNGLVFSPNIGIDNINMSQAHDNNIIIAPVTSVGLDLRYPLLFQENRTALIFEPIIQIYLRNQLSNHLIQPIDTHIIHLTALQLFQRDKFYGYNYIEDHSRLNTGFRAYGAFTKNWHFYAIAGRSFATHFHDKAGILNDEDKKNLYQRLSDYMAYAAIEKNNFSLALSANLHPEKAALRQAEVNIAKTWKKLFISIGYNYLEPQIINNFDTKYHALTLFTKLQINHNWSIHLASDYNLIKNNVTEIETGIKYENSCLALTTNYKQLKDIKKNAANHKFSFTISLR